MDLLAFWLILPLNVDFLTRLSCVIVYLLSRAQMCAVFWDAAFGGRPPEFTRLRLAVVSGSTNQNYSLKKTFFEILTLVRNCIFCVEFKSEFDKKKYLSFRGEKFNRSWVPDDENRQYPKFFLVELGYGFLSKFYAYYVFQILNLTSEKGSILLNRQLSAKGKPALYLS